MTQAAIPDHGPAVVRAWAPWCGSCRALAPVVAATAERDGIEVVDLRVDAEPVLVERFGVRSIPTLIAFRDGVETGRLVGVQSADAVSDLFRAAAGGDAAARSRPPAGLTALRAAVAVVVGGAGALLGSAALVAVGALLGGWALADVRAQRGRSPLTVMRRMRRACPR